MRRSKEPSAVPQEMLDRWAEQNRQQEAQRVRREALTIAVDLAKLGTLTPEYVVPFAEKVERYLSDRTT